MDDKDLIAQNLEEKNDTSDAVISPAKKRTKRKKTASQKNSDTEKKEEKDNDTDKSDDYENEDVFFLPLLSMSSEDSSSENILDENENANSPISKVDEDIDFILPPDEIFAVSKISEDQIDGAEENEPLPEAEGESDLGEINDDGQYRLLDIDPINTDQQEQIKEKATQKQYDPQKPRRIDRFFDFIELVVFTLLAVMIVTSFFFRHSIVDGESMENTLHSGEHLIISDLFYTPKHGDVIVCEDYTTAIPKPIVKRVIAIEGDTVKITPDGNVFVNGNLLDEGKYVHIDELGYIYKELELTVPPNELFVMGDHRNKSTDSREIGTVSEDSVLGKVLLRFYPFNKFGKVD